MGTERASCSGFLLVVIGTAFALPGAIFAIVWIVLTVTTGAVTTTPTRSPAAG